MDITPLLSRRVQAIAPSATKIMAQLAARRGDCVSLGQGVPSFATSEEVVAAVTHIVQTEPASGKYTLQPGLSQLRQRLARYMWEHQQTQVDAEQEICVTVGGMEGLLATVLSVVNPGDEVILPSPTYASYIEQIHLAEGVPVFVPLQPNWQLDEAAIRQAISTKTKAIMLCTPGNPTGNVLRDTELAALCELAREAGLVLILDTTYDYLNYGPANTLFPLSKPQWRNHVVCVSSLSKKYALTGWRIGWVTAAAELMHQIMKVHDATAICAPTPSQYAALAALDSDPQWLTDCRQKLIVRRALCCQRLDQLDQYFAYVPPQGAFYIMARYLFSQENSTQVATQLLQETGVITVPGNSFGAGGEGHLRLSFGGSETEINEAFDRLERWLKR